MTFRYPDLVGMQQLRQKNPPEKYGRFNCAAYAGRGLADVDSKGALVYPGYQVRLNTDEPIPDIGTPQNPGSPGLNWQQIDSSLFRLSQGRVNLDVHSGGSPFSVVGPALRAGRWAGLAVRRGTLVDAGYGGTDDFRGAHAVIAGYDQDRKRYVLGDPLVPRWIDLPLSALERACRMFLVTSGYGAGATGWYGALTRDVFDAPTSGLRYSALFTPGSFWRYQAGATGSRTAQKFAKATSAPCDAPELLLFNGAYKKLVRIRKGALEGYWVEPGSSHVTLKVTK